MQKTRYQNGFKIVSIKNLETKEEQREEIAIQIYNIVKKNDKI